MTEAFNPSAHDAKPLKTQPRGAAALTAVQPFACPYCERRLLETDDILWDHVLANHDPQIQSSGFKESTALFRKLLRDEALHKARVLAEQQRGTEKPTKSKARPAEPIIAGSIPDLNPLTLEAKRSPTRKGEPPGSNRSSRKRAGEDISAAETPNRSPVRQDANTRRARGMAEAEPRIVSPEVPPAYFKEIPYHISSDALRSKQSLKTSYNTKVSPVTRVPPRTQPPPSASPQDQSSHLQAHHKTHRQPSLVSVQQATGSSVSSPSPCTANSLLSHQEGVLQLPSSDARWPDLVLQPDSRPISQEQLAAEVKSIYAGLTMVESKCIHVDKAQAAAGPHTPLANDHWQALIALHRTLLHEHHDFFLASQHPSASDALRRLAAKYSMPARMWKHGIHSFLELLRHRLPESLDYMLAFIYLAYQMMALLYETVPAFEDTWIECLGDLGRYRMAIEDEDLRDRETWASVARFWYSKAADKSPSIGRLYHHLAILARPNALQQLYYYCRSLACVQPFMSARESILTLFDPILGRTKTSYSHSLPVETSFIRAHGLLFEKSNNNNTFDNTLADFTGQLDNSIGRVTSKWKEQGAYIAIANITSLFDYGSEDNFLRRCFATQLRDATNKQATDDDLEPLSVQEILPPSHRAPDDLELDVSSAPTISSSCRLTFNTLNVVLQRFGDKNVFTHFHILLAFLVQLSTLPQDTSYIFSHVAWKEFSFFLNTLAKSEPVSVQIESASFLHEGQEDSKPLPEDYLIRGQLWAHAYFPVKWFDGVNDEEERMLELASTIKSRTERILWLGVRLAECNRGLCYDRDTQTWSPSAEVDDEIGDRDDDGGSGA